MNRKQAQLYGQLLETYMMGGETHQDRMVAVERLVDANNGDWLRKHRKRKQLIDELDRFLRSKMAGAPGIN